MGNIMSNTKLKEQIEAAKIALVHSAETRSSDETPSTSGTVTQITKISSDDAHPHVESVGRCRVQQPIPRRQLLA